MHTEPSRLPRASIELLERLLQDLFPDLRAATGLEDFEAALEWLELRRGEVLCRAGEQADAMYLIVHGRMLVLSDDPDAAPRATLGAGDVVGEWGLLSDGKRSATVMTGKRSYVARLGRAAFERLAQRDAGFLREIAAAIVHRARAGDRCAAAQARTFVVVRLSEAPAIDGIVDALAGAVSALRPTAWVDAARASAALQLDAAPLTPGGRDEVRVEAWLDEIEERSDALWLDAGRGGSAWSELALARADHVVLIAAAPDAPDLRPCERGLHTHAQAHQPDVSLVLCHPEGTQLPSGTRSWRAPRRLRAHYHIAAGNAGDVHRAARLLSGCGVGLVLAGGGALGAAHVGVIAALLERGVPIDYVGGTSAGGGIAAVLAMVRDFEAFHDLLARHFVDDNPMRWLTLPVVSLVQRSKVDDTARSMFGDVMAEDLWIPWFCVSSNLRTGRTVVHTEGPVWRAVRATTSIPGMMPPMLEDGDLLLDGGLLDNFPVMTMAALCGGPVIGSGLGTAADEKLTMDYDDLPGALDMIRIWLRRKPRPPRLPTIPYVMMQLAVIGSKPNREAQVRACAWYFQPKLRGFTMSDYKRFGDIARLGYAEVRERLEGLSVAALVPGWSSATPPSHRGADPDLPARFGQARSRGPWTRWGRGLRR